MSNILVVKLNNIYEVSIKANKSSICLYEQNGFNMFVYPCKCSTVSEKIKILTLLLSSLTKNETSSLFPDITIYMIERAKSLVQEKGVYSELEAYTGHPIREKTEKVVIGY